MRINLFLKNRNEYLNTLYISGMIVDRCPCIWAAVVISSCHKSHFVFLLSNKSKDVKKQKCRTKLCVSDPQTGGVNSCATVALLEDEDGMNASSCLCCSCDPAGGLGWPSLTSGSPVKMADCMPPLLLEACVVLGASEDKLAGVCQVSSHQDDLEIVTLTVLPETEMMAVPADPHRPWLFSGAVLWGCSLGLFSRAVLCSLREHKEVFSTCETVRQINVLRFGGTNPWSCSDCAEEQKQMWWTETWNTNKN